MKKLYKLITLFAVSAILAGCTPTSGNQPGDKGKEMDYIVANPDFSTRVIQDKESATYEDLFDFHNKVSISIEVDREEMQKINDDNVYTGDFDTIKPETYHLAKKFTLSLINNNKTYTWELENVGIRQKGNTSRKPIFKDNGELNNRNHFKINFQETFDDPAKYSEAFIQAHGNQEYKDREILGLSGIDFKWNKTDDTTYLRESYANMMLRSAGILAQHVGLSTVRMIYDGSSKADFGLCYIYEQSNKEFIKRALQSETPYIGMSSWEDEKAGTHGVEGSKYGDLYKASYGKGDGASSGANFTTGSIYGKRLGVKTDIEGRNYPTYERKTDKKKDYNDTQMRELVQALSGNNLSYKGVDAKVDLEYLAMEEAVMYFLGNPDAMKYNYNNYLVYFRRTDGKMIIVPIDNDRAFGVGNGWQSGLEKILSKNCKPFSGKPLSGDQANPLLREIIFSNNENTAQKNYKKALELVRNSTWLTNATFEQFYNIIKTTYHGVTEFSLDGGNGNISFSTYIDIKKNIYDGLEPGSYTINVAPEDDPNRYVVPNMPLDRTYYVIGSMNSWGEDITDSNVDSFAFSYNENKNELMATFPILDDRYSSASGTVQFFIQDSLINNQGELTFGVRNDDPNHLYKRVEGEFYPTVINFSANVDDTASVIVSLETGEVFINVDPKI